MVNLLRWWSFILFYKLHFVDVSLIDALLNVGQAADVQRRMGQRGVHPGQAKDGQKGRHQGHNEQIPVVGGSFFQSEKEEEKNQQRSLRMSTRATTPAGLLNNGSLWPLAFVLVARVVDHGGRDVLIHEEEEGQREAHAHGAEDGEERETLQGRHAKDVLVVVPKPLHRHVLEEVGADKAERDDGHGQRVVGQGFPLAGLQVGRLVEIVEGHADPDGAEHEEEEEEGRGSVALDQLGHRPVGVAQKVRHHGVGRRDDHPAAATAAHVARRQVSFARRRVVILLEVCGNKKVDWMRPVDRRRQLIQRRRYQ